MTTMRVGRTITLLGLLAAGAVTLLLWSGATPPSRDAATPGPRAVGSDRSRAESLRFERSDFDARIATIDSMRDRQEPDVLRALGRALSDASPDIRYAAFRAIADMALADSAGHELTVLLRQALADPDPHIRMDALDALAARGDQGLAAVRDAVADPSADVSEYARDLLLRVAAQ